MKNFSFPAARLVPPPRRLVALPDRFTLPPCLGWSIPADSRIARELLARGTHLGAGPDLDWQLDLDLPAEAYWLRLDEQGLKIRSRDQTGWRHALRTLGQWLATEPPGREVGGLEVEDAPSFGVRGFMVDISRNRVPTWQNLVEIVETCAELKLNQLQLYLEHTFAYRDHEEVWQGYDPVDGALIEALERLCTAQGIELVANQNSFGHFHRWLVHSRYRPLAECPEGIEHPFSLVKEPFSLCPLDPASLDLLRDLYDQLLPHFSSRLFNTGLDETFDLGRGRSAADCGARGKAMVYLDFLNAVDRLVTERGRRMMFWGDIVLEHPELIASLPADAIALEWGYEADHPFERDAGRFAAAGRPFYVCPGTSSWNSFAGRVPNALVNLAAAAQAGARHGAAGYLITDWGDHGHLQPWPISWPGLVVGAACAWNAEVATQPETLPVAAWIDDHVAHDRAGRAGSALLALGETYRLTGAKSQNGSALFFALMHAHKKWADRRGQGMTREHLDRVGEHLAAIEQEIAAFDLARPDQELVAQELRWVITVSDLAARLAFARIPKRGDDGVDDLALSALPADLRTRLARDLAHAGEALRPIWRARSRPGGLEASIARFLHVRGLIQNVTEIET